jgi:lysophospholipase L1-like esterase
MNVRAIRLAGVLLVAIEGILWVFGPFLAPTVVRGEDRGYLYVPNMRSARLDAESGLLLRTHTNAFGALDRDWAAEELRTTLKIAAIRNSYVAGQQVPQSSRFTERLEAHLDADGIATTVMNFGVNGQNIINYLDISLYLDRTIHPDILVLGLNDQSNFAHEQQVTFRYGDRWTYLAHDGNFTMDRRSLDTLDQVARSIIGILRHSWLVRTAHQGFQTLQFNLPRLFLGEESGAACPGWLAESDPQGPPPDTVLLTANIVREIARAVSAKVIVVEMPSEMHTPTPKDGGCPRSHIHGWLYALLADSDVIVVPTLESMMQAGKSTHYPGGHLNERGHAVIADTLADYVERMVTAHPRGKPEVP